MRKVLIACLVLGILGLGAFSVRLFLERNQVEELKKTSHLPAYGEPLAINNSAGNNTGVLSQISEPEQVAPTKEELQKYEQYKAEKQILLGEIKVGDGIQAVGGTKVAINYTGYLTTGQVFDKNKEPFVFQVGAHKVIPGFEQGVAGMKVGSKRRIIIPPALGYGNKAQGQIPANSVLIFDVELIAAQ